MLSGTFLLAMILKRNARDNAKIKYQSNCNMVIIKLQVFLGLGFDEFFFV